MPERHLKHIRISTSIERSFSAIKSRGKVIWRFLTETSALMMVFGILTGERLKWQKVRMKADYIDWIEEAKEALGQEPGRLDLVEKILVA